MSSALDSLDIWNDALTTLQLLQVTPHDFGGVCLRASYGPVRDRWLAELTGLNLPLVKVPSSVDAERMLGGIDLSLTLQTGKLHLQAGLLQQAHMGLVCLPMAERFAPSLIAPLVQVMETGQIQASQYGATSGNSAPAQLGVIALDESLPDEPGVNAVLRERLGIWLDLNPVLPTDVQLFHDQSIADPPSVKLSAEFCEQVRETMQQMQWTDEQLLALCAAAFGLGITSLRIPSLALRVASCHAALNGRTELQEDDLSFAARCVLAPRATQWPADQRPEEPEAESASPPEESTSAAQEPDDRVQDPSESSQDPAEQRAEPSPEDLQEMMVAAALASLPSQVLDALMTGQGSNRSKTSGRSGQLRSGQQRGRPLPPRPGRPGGQARLHILATLRAAAPKQRLRQRPAHHQGIAIRTEDFHVQRYQQRSSTCLILALDASGSAATQRLAEAKGAVELLLTQSYARRDNVCIVSFRGAQAQLLLPMTRSLVRAKRAMTALPGGGGTPLALALKMVNEQATLLQRQGITPMLVVLSDGRANVTLQGVGGRAQAQADALLWGRQWGLSRHRALWIDTSQQPDPQAQQLAATMGASYLPMPQVQAQRMADAMGNLRGRQA
jgi:magnesium chelatase subunit D